MNQLFSWPQWKKDFLIAVSAKISNREAAQILGGTASAVANQIVTIGIPKKTKEQAKFTQSRALTGQKRGEGAVKVNPNQRFDGTADNITDALEQVELLLAAHQPVIRKSSPTGFAPGSRSNRSKFDIEDETKYRKIQVRDFTGYRELRIDQKTVLLIPPGRTDEQAIANYNRNLERTNQAFARMA